MRKFVDYYKVLGISKKSDAAAIRHAYVKLAKDHHPDRGGSTERMDRINKAYSVLKDPAMRVDYDNDYWLHYRAHTDQEFESVFDVPPAEANYYHHKQDIIGEMKQGLGWATGATFVTIVLYLATNAGIAYLLAIPALFYGLLVLLKATHTFFTQAYVEKKPRRSKLAKSLNSPTAKTAAVFLLVAIILFSTSALVVSQKYQKQPSTIYVPNQEVIYESELKKLEQLRESYDGCIETFKQVTNQLNRVNQSLDAALAKDDTEAYSRLTIEQNTLVDEYAKKRVECTEIQNNYNEQVGSYRQRVEQD